jgi:hypothetical protein
MVVISTSSCRRADAAGAAAAPLLTGFVRKIKARLVRRHKASMFQPYRDLLRCPQGGVGRQRSYCSM